MSDALTSNFINPLRTPRDLEAEAREAQSRLTAAQDAARAAEREAQQALRRKATLLEREAPSWEVLQRDPYGVSEILEVQGGFFVRSIWQRPIAIGQPPAQGSAVLFVAGPAPRLVPAHGSIVVSFRDIRAGAEPANALLSDVEPSRRLDEAAEVLLRLADGSVRVLKGHDPLPDARPEDGLE